MTVAYTSSAAIKSHAGITDATSDTILASIATAVNATVEDWLGFPAGSSGTAARTYDGDGSDELYVRGGVTGLQTLEIADGTGGTFSTVTTYVLRPYGHERPQGWPAWYVQLTDLAVTSFTAGYQTVRLTPGTAGHWDFPAAPEELKRIADVMGVRMFQARQSGETMVIGSTDFGQAIVRFLPEPEYRDILDHYAYTLGGKRRAG